MRTIASPNGRFDIILDDRGRETWDGDAVLVQTGDHSVGWAHETELND